MEHLSADSVQGLLIVQAPRAWSPAVPAGTWRQQWVYKFPSMATQSTIKNLDCGVLGVLAGHWQNVYAVSRKHNQNDGDGTLFFMTNSEQGLLNVPDSNQVGCCRQDKLPACCASQPTPSPAVQRLLQLLLRCIHDSHVVDHVLTHTCKATGRHKLRYSNSKQSDVQVGAGTAT